jgi:hypothetical protein
MLLLLLHGILSQQQSAVVPPDPASPGLLVACDASDARQQWDILRQKMQEGVNASQLVLASDHTEALVCHGPQTPGHSSERAEGCFQGQANWHWSGGSTFVLNSTSGDNGAAVASAGGGFLIQSYDGRWLRAVPSPPGTGSCAKIGCGAKYSKQHPCQCFDGCEKYNACCSDYERLCTDVVYVLAPNRTDGVAPGTPVNMRRDSSLDLRNAVFTYLGSTKALRHVVSGLCLAQAPPPHKPVVNVTMFHVRPRSVRLFVTAKVSDLI